MIVLIVASLLLALVGVSLYHRVEHWRLRAILEERERLAHEMHDTLAQSFAGIGFQLQAIRNGLPDHSSPINQQLELACNLVRHSHEEARRSIATLRSEDLESEDILVALDRCARRMVEGGSVEVVSEREGDQRTIPLRIADTLYRIGQEAVANAVRHAQPGILTIRLRLGLPADRRRRSRLCAAQRPAGLRNPRHAEASAKHLCRLSIAKQAG